MEWRHHTDSIFIPYIVNVLVLHEVAIANNAIISAYTTKCEIPVLLMRDVSYNYILIMVSWQVT